MGCISSELPVITAVMSFSNIYFALPICLSHEILLQLIQDTVGSDNLPRLVKKQGPLTKKVVASGSHFPGLDFSL